MSDCPEEHIKLRFVKEQHLYIYHVPTIFMNMKFKDIQGLLWPYIHLVDSMCYDTMEQIKQSNGIDVMHRTSTHIW